MQEVTYVIVEDEQKSRQTLLQKIDLCNLSNLLCVGLASDFDEAQLLIENNHPDILLLDINLPGKNGFECLEAIKTVDYNPETIFTSAYSQNEYLLKALKSGAVNYLIKPIPMDELTASLVTAISRVELKRNQISTSGKIKLNGTKEVLFLKLEQIAYCKADGHYSQVFLTTGKIETICQRIGSLEKILPGNMFFRTDRSTLINSNLIESIDLKKQTCKLIHEDFLQIIDVSVIGLKRLIERLEK
jgi:two-component system LytT family response regulator